MDIRLFAKSLDSAQRREIAKRAGTNTVYLSQLANGHRKASVELAKKLVRASQQVFPIMRESEVNY